MSGEEREGDGLRAALAEEARRKRPRRRRRGMGPLSPPGAILGLCLILLAVFIWSAGTVMTGAARDAAVGAEAQIAPELQAAALAYLCGTPAALLLLGKKYWRRMRRGLRRMGRALGVVWAGVATLALITAMS